MSILSPENFKSKAKLARQFLKEKYRLDVSHSHCIELVSQIFGFKDWNTAKAKLTQQEWEPWEKVKALAEFRSKEPEDSVAAKDMTVGELRKALEKYDDAATIDADYEFNLGEFMNSIEDMNSPEDMVHQEFVLTTVDKVDVDYANLKLKIKHESCSFEF